MPAEDTIAQELRNELEARLSAYKQERTTLQQAVTRIAELDALIAFSENETPTVRIAPRPRPAPQSEVPPTRGPAR